MAEPRVWALLGKRHGDNNQVLALAEALGLSFEVKNLDYNHWRHLRPRLLGATARSLTKESRAQLSGELPDLTISTGIRSVPVVQWLRHRSGGRLRSVHIGYPRLSPSKFDLVVATPEYPVPDDPRLLRIPFALTRLRKDDVDAKFEAAHPRPRRLVVLGGPTLFWSLKESTVVEALRSLCQRAVRDNGSMLVIGSPRTPKTLLGAASRAVRAAHVPAILAPIGGSPSYGELLHAADEIYVTADSVAMISDAIATGKPVGIIPLERSAFGRVYVGLMDRWRPDRRVRPRDLRFFWRELEQRQLVGTLDQPRADNTRNPRAVVSAQLLSILRDQAERPDT